MTARLRLLRLTAAATISLALVGCATQRPDDSPSPGPVAAPTSAAPEAPATPDPASYEPTVFAPTPTGLAGLGVTVTGPPGYRDVTADIQAGLDGEGQRVVGAWANDDGTIIALREENPGEPDLAAFVAEWVASMDADGDYRVTAQHPATMGGVPAVRLDMTDKDSGAQDVAYLTVRPGFTLVLTGPGEAAAALETVAGQVSFA